MSAPSAYFLVGVGGSGMAPLALLLRAEGHTVRGSDRDVARPGIRERFERLLEAGVQILPQDGSGPRPGDRVVLSSAIEGDNPDWLEARRLRLVVQHRAEVLAQLFNRRRGVAVAGTSGKSTTTAMLAFVLQRLGLSPSVMAGAEIHGLGSDGPVAALAGSGELFVIEADESDGSFLAYEPEIGIVANISKDHMELPRLVELFEVFAARCRGAVVLGSDCPRARALHLAGPRVHRFGLEAGETRAEGVQLGPGSVRFTVAGVPFDLPVTGAYNVKNALAVIATCRELGLGLAEVAQALSGFRGLRRRFELAGTARGVEVYDDYAHNPDKLAAILDATAGRRRILLFQPHGYGPTRFLLEDLAQAFAAHTSAQDRIVLLPIFDAGGTADRSIRSEDLAEAVERHGGRAQAAQSRPEAVRLVVAEARAGDCVLVLGARDPSLTLLARDIVSALQG